MSTYTAKKQEIVKSWILYDAKDVVLGRLASDIALKLRGKDKPYFTPHLDCGDNVIVINARHIYLTNNKRKSKLYYRHSGYPGGISSRTADDIMSGDRPEDVLKLAIKRMLPGGPLSRTQMKNLRIYPDEDYGQVAQKPKKIDFSKANSKNVRR